MVEDISLTEMVVFPVVEDSSGEMVSFRVAEGSYGTEVVDQVSLIEDITLLVAVGTDFMEEEILVEDLIQVSIDGIVRRDQSIISIETFKIAISYFPVRHIFIIDRFILEVIMEEDIFLGGVRILEAFILTMVVIGKDHGITPVDSEDRETLIQVFIRDLIEE